MYFKGGNIILLLALTLHIASAQYPCLTPYNTYGLCVHSDQCDFLQKLFTQYGLSLPQQYREDVQKARCLGANPNEFYLCCESSSSPTIATRPTRSFRTRATRPTPASNTPTPAPNTATNIATNTAPNSALNTAPNAPAQLNARGLSILRAQKCGSVDGNKVANGKKADLFEFPWMALLRYNDSDQPFRCGGTLITDRHVLTAAHCVVSKPLMGVRLGEYNLNSEQDCVVIRERSICALPVEDYGIEDAISHPDFSVSYKSNDVALIKLERSVQFKQHIKPICLPIDERAAKLPKERQFYIAGWGLTETGSTLSNILQRATVPFLSRTDCQSFFGVTTITDGHICAGGQDKIDACSGDSGGPLFYLAPYRTSRRYVQYGVVSFGKLKCGADDNLPGIYANVVKYMPWITENLN